MLLTVSGLNAAPIRFKHLWGRYVLGFKPWNHCLASFETKIASPVTPQMKDGEYPLSDDHGRFYLCGYLTHEDTETWMDARRSSDLASYSPPSTRANDIQALWYEQLRTGAEFATTMGDTVSATRWTQAATRVREHFVHDFFNPKTGLVADHLTGENKPDFTLRPNMLIVLDLVGDEQVFAPALRKSWESLVFPWGVATLDPNDPFFHAYHLALEQYRKDEAYHNGTFWPWLNGIAIQRMIEEGQIDLA